MTSDQRESLYTVRWLLRNRLSGAASDLDAVEWHLAKALGETAVATPADSPGGPPAAVPPPEDEPPAHLFPAFEVTPNHWLTGAARDPLEVGGGPMAAIRFLVIHFTAGASAESSVSWWRKSRAASAHLVIDRDGHVIQCRPLNRKAWHAGKSAWSDPTTGRRFSGLNSCSIGIELANGGDGFPRAFSELPPTIARHKHGGPVKEWETYTEAQLFACFAVAKAIVARYGLADVIGHEDIAPARKVDPGPAFPLADLREHCGFPRELSTG